MYYSAYTVLKDSINKNEFKECIMGKGKYKYEDKNNSGPVDENIILQGIYELYSKEPELAVNEIFERIMIEMIEGSIEELYLAVYYIFEQVGNECKKVAPFVINMDVIFQKVTEVVKVKKIEFESINDLERLNIKGNIMKKIIKINEFSVRKYDRKIFDY